jgi:E3 ubiquitin-protein ligase TRIP12
VRLVEDFTCGSKLAAVRKQFRKGLFSVIENGIWNRLTASEKVMLISGDSSEITMSDLEAHISFEHGYDSRCPQRRMLFETICEFDEYLRRQLFKFITGCERLPIGGLAALTPKITVARRISQEGQAPDETLPTASTCNHYFKLPSYSSKRILRERIILAVTEGSIGFDLS